MMFFVLNLVIFRVFGTTSFACANSSDQDPTRSSKDDISSKTYTDEDFTSQQEKEIHLNFPDSLGHFQDEMSDGCYFNRELEHSLPFDDSLVCSRFSDTESREARPYTQSDPIQFKKPDYDFITKKIDEKIQNIDENGLFQSDILAHQMFFSLILITDYHPCLKMLEKFHQNISRNTGTDSHLLNNEFHPFFGFEFTYLAICLRIEHLNYCIYLFEKKKQVFMQKILNYDIKAKYFTDILDQEFTLNIFELEIEMKTEKITFPTLSILSDQLKSYCTTIDSLLYFILNNYKALFDYTFPETSDGFKELAEIEFQEGLNYDYSYSKTQRKCMTDDFLYYQYFLKEKKSEIEGILNEIISIGRKSGFFSPEYISKKKLEDLYLNTKKDYDSRSKKILNKK